MQNKKFKIAKVDRLPESEVQITGEITLSFLVECRKEAVKYLGKNADIPGFRAGHVPEDILVKHLGEMRVLEEAAEVALGREYENIMKEAEISPIGRPNVSITKLAPGVPLEFNIKVATEPEFKLPDYKKIAKETLAELKDEKIEVNEKEIKDTLVEIEKRGIKPDIKEGEKLEDKVKESILAQKELQNKEKKRLSVIEKLVKETKLTPPKVLIESELAKMLAQFQGDVERMGAKWADYLKQAKKTEEDIKKEWEDQAIQRVKAELIISKIAVEEKIEPAKSDVEHEVKHLISHHPEADPLRARIYIYTQLRNQKVFDFLEGLGDARKSS